MFYYLCVILFCTITWYRYKKRRFYELAAKLQGSEEALPIIGNAHALAGNAEDILSSLQYYSYCAMKVNGMAAGWLSHILYVLMVNPVDLEYLLKTCLEKDDLHRFIHKAIGHGGIFAPVSIWRRRRKIMLPAFSPKIVETFMKVFSERSQTLIKKFDKHIEENSSKKVNVWPFLNTFTMDTIFQTAMGINIDAQNNPNSPFLIAINRVLNLICERIFHLWLQPDWLYKMFPKSRVHDSDIKYLHKFIDDLISKKREELSKEENTKPNHQYDLCTMYQQKTFLDLLIEISAKHNGYTNVELREEILTLTVAGTDTSAVATGYTLMMLAKYPDIQEKVYEELCNVFGDSDRLIEKEDLMQLKYLERVIKETLRLFPPVPFIIRKVEEEVTLPSGCKLPAGCGVVVCIWGAHRDPMYWGPDAEVFDPDRFLPERFNLEHPCSYMPFSQGPRNCLGYQYALMSIKTVLGSVLRNFKVVPDPEFSRVPYIRVKLEIMMKPVDGYQIGLERRKPVTEVAS